ncbi:beta-galactosidase GalA [Flavisolibacter ginsenosidimutans]|uniref:Glycoside hydrolase family 2 protein n=1 Tax=Flavisolibacter ginsenosidimutans TaxID=661481 RepID=A0A5B8UGR5_9BACT|nr:glycoside hydrolase family 2 protein [Flavisolibacter ginsenosidimutans]
MKKSCLLLTIVCYISIVNGQSISQKINFDNDWKFALGNASDPTKDFSYSLQTIFAKAGEKNTTAASASFIDSSWRLLNLPHDWAVELPFVNHPDKGVMRHGYKPVGGFFPATSVGWYRKHFRIPAADSGQRFSVTFDGIYRDADVWFNNQYLKKNLSGYNGFTVDITDFIRYGGDNVLSVRVNATQYEGWFYEGAGIYRHVWLNKYNNLHLEESGTFVYADMPSLDKATVHTAVEIKNDDYNNQSVFLNQFIADRSGKKIANVAAQTVRLGFNERQTVKNEMQLINPQLWDVANPYLYRLVTVLKNKEGRTLDSVTTKFGCRQLRFDANEGMFLNGKSIKIKGVCNHQDHAGVGSAIPDALQYYRLRLLKEMGANACRTTHNPPTPEFLEACDSLGMLVLDETRLLNSSEEYLDQFEQLLRRDRNHPSIFMWSVGNEETAVQNNSLGKRIAQKMIALQQQIDPSRLSTYAANMPNYFTGVNEVIPVRGFNYHIGNIDAYHRDHPAQPIIGTEVASTVCTRGIYAIDTVNAYVPDYDSNYPSWASTSETWWRMFAERKWLIGGFVWTGFDYRGEPTPYEWPNINSHFGIMDVCGFPKSNYYYYQSWWSDKDVLKIYPHWNHAGMEGKTIEVWCNSNAGEVELSLNEKSLGKKTMPLNGHLVWKVVYQPGTLKAIAFKNGKKLEDVVTTTDKGVQVKIVADREDLNADGRDVVVYNVSVIDGKGKEVPDADNELLFDLSGSGKMIGVGNGDPSSHEQDVYAEGQQWKRKLFSGKCQVIVQSNGGRSKVNFVARGEGLKPASVTTSVVKN